MKLLPLLFALTVAAWPAQAQTPAPPDVISEVRARIAANDLDGADATFKSWRAKLGDRPDVLAALSWLGRGSLAAGQLERANQYAVDAQRLAVAALGSRKLDTEPHLATAIGAGIEVQALVRVRTDARSDAVAVLRRELEKYKDTSISKRIQKNMNLASLEGAVAHPLDISEFIGPKPKSLDQLKGKAVVLFFWAHWCPDCKAQGPILEKLYAKYQSQGLEIVAPTQRFGYVAAGKTAPPDEELRHIVAVRDQNYGFLKGISVPLSEANHQKYGVSSTPTLAIVDRQGIVRVYNPGKMTEEALEAQIRKVLDAGPGTKKTD